MLPSPCMMCSRMRYSNEGSSCWHCDSYATMCSGVEDTLHPIHPEITTSRYTDVAVESRNYLTPNEIQTSCKDFKNNQIGNESNESSNKEIIQCQNERKQEICNNANVNNDFFTDTMGTTNHLSCNSAHSAEIHYECQNVTDPQWNIDILKNYEKDNAASNIFQSGIPLEESVLNYIDNIIAIPDPSEFQGCENVSNESGKILHSNKKSETNSIVFEKKDFTCRVCETKIRNHAKIRKGKIQYSCCVCTYKTHKTADLRIHCDLHCSRKICNVCSKEYTEGDSHETEKTCFLCEQTFQCSTLLEEHSLNHENYYITHCWVCKLGLEEHFREEEGKKNYECCICDSDLFCFNKLTMHNDSHRPKLFCKICREEYCTGEKSLHNSEYKCNLCEEKFQCKVQLEDHSGNHSDHFNKYCIVCNRDIYYYHEIGKEGIIIYQCCKCLKTFIQRYNFVNHMYSHSDLRLFKCDACRKRFVYKKTLNNHLKTCMSLPYKCKICRARFHCNDSLESHHLEKHKN